MWSRAAWDKVAAIVGDTSCGDASATGLPSDELALAHCALALGVVPVDFHLYDGSGAIQRNGVPLEPGPPDMSRLDWLALPPTRAGHWAYIDNLGSANWQGGGGANDIWAQYVALYGPWGLLPSIAAIPSPPPPQNPSGSVAVWMPDGIAAPCAVRAAAALSALLNAARTSPTAAQPLTLDVAVGATAAACDPGGAAGGDPPATAGLRDATPAHLCFLLLEEGGAAQTQLVMGAGWVGRVARGAGARRMWVAAAEGSGGVAAAGTAALPIPGWDALPNNAARVAAALAAQRADPNAAHCEWTFIGTTTDWVNPFAMSGMLRGLRPDAPVAVGFFFHGKGDLDEPALGKVVLSAGAGRAIGARMPGCVGGGDSSSGAALARCMWGAGVTPVTSYYMDVANFGPNSDCALCVCVCLRDAAPFFALTPTPFPTTFMQRALRVFSGAFQQPHYTQGWALIVDCAAQERNVHILESYFSGLYGQAFNQTNEYSRAAVADFWTAWGFIPPPDSRRELSGGSAEAAARVVAASRRDKLPSWARV